MTQLFGEKNGQALLTAEIVIAIRAAAQQRRTLSNKALATKYNVSLSSVRNVLKGARWRHVR